MSEIICAELKIFQNIPHLSRFSGIIFPYHQVLHVVCKNTEQRRLENEYLICSTKHFKTTNILALNNSNSWFPTWIDKTLFLHISVPGNLFALEINALSKFHYKLVKIQLLSICKFFFCIILCSNALSMYGMPCHTPHIYFYPSCEVGERTQKKTNFPLEF